jgi:zinc protease
VFTADRLVLGVAGGYPKELPQELARALGSLPEQGAPAVAVPQKAAAATPRFRLVEKDTASTAISLGMPWPLSRRDPDFVALTVARSAFGEHRQFNGRLMKRLREQRGLNYGDYAYLEQFEQEGGEAATAQTGRVRHQQNFSIWLRPVQNENRLFALRAALYELKRSLGEEPFSDEEVEATKSFLDGYLLLFAQTDARKLGYALDDRFLGTDDFLRAWRQKLAAVTPAQVNAAWRKWVDPSKLQIVMVTPGAAALKKQILADAPSPMHYQKDAQGNTPERPKSLLATDALIEKLPLEARSDAGVEVVPVGKMFE